jgi:hypothetical protein
VGSSALKLDQAPTSFDPTDPAPLSSHYYSDLRSSSTPTSRYHSQRANYSLHLPTHRPYSVSRPHAIKAAIQTERERLGKTYWDNFSYYWDKEHKDVTQAARALQRLDEAGLTERQAKRTFFKTCQQERPARAVPKHADRDFNRAVRHADRRLKREVKNRYIDALDAELGDPNLVLCDGGDFYSSEGTVDGFHEGYYGDLVDKAVEGFTKKTGKRVCKDWKELGVEEGNEGFWGDIGEEEWERIVLEEEMLFSEVGQSEKLGSDWDWALVRDEWDE